MNELRSFVHSRFCPIDQEFIFYHPDEPSSLSAPESYRYHRGHQAWILQAYQHLKQSGFPCTLSTTFPDEGVIIAFRTAFPPSARPSRRRFLVCVQADYTPLPFSNFDVVQNPSQAGNIRGKLRHYVPHYPQAGLIPRAQEHVDRFRRVGYFGRLYGVNRSPVLASPGFRRWLPENDFELVIADDPEYWHDYSNIDAVVAVRSFNSLHKHKPATKLVNAWMAKVPAILGPESAYRALRCSHLDYIEVDSVVATQNALTLLRENPALRSEMVKHGQSRAQHYAFEVVTKAWADLLNGPVSHAAERWFSDAVLRKRFILTRRLGLGFVDHAECMVQQRGIFGALRHSMRRPFQLAARVDLGSTAAKK